MGGPFFALLALLFPRCHRCLLTLFLDVINVGASKIAVSAMKVRNEF